MMADVIREKEKHDKEQEELKNRPSPEKQCEDTKNLINNYYNEWKEKGEIRDVFSICYNFLRKHKFMVINKDMIDEAMAYGLKMARAKDKPLFEKVNPDNEEAEQRRYARNWCVQNYFKNVDIDILLNNINSELFT
jgi:hypothetical protein